MVISTITSSNLYYFYQHYKNTFSIEPYILQQPNVIRTNICRFRCSNHQLEIERGRQLDIERHNRICNLCNLNALGDEYHHVMECNNAKILNARKKFIPVQVYKSKSSFRFIEFMYQVGHNKTAGSRFSRFIKECK